MYVSGRESDYIEGCSMVTRYVLANDCSLMRWVDDVVHVQPQDIRGGPRKALNDMKREHFYAPELDLKEEDTDQAFSFEWREERGILKVRAVCKYQEAFQGNGERKEWPELHGGTSFGSEVWKKGAILGRMIRILDMTDESEQGAR